MAAARARGPEQVVGEEELEDPVEALAFQEAQEAREHELRMEQAKSATAELAHKQQLEILESQRLLAESARKANQGIRAIQEEDKPASVSKLFKLESANSMSEKADQIDLSPSIIQGSRRNVPVLQCVNTYTQTNKRYAYIRLHMYNIYEM